MTFLWWRQQDSTYIFASGEDNGSHQCLHWWQQHATGMLLCDRFESYVENVATKEKSHPVWDDFSLVDDIGLEPMTFRTSSGCSSQLS